MHFDDAYAVLIKYLAALPESKGRAARAAQAQGHGGDLWIPHVVQGYWQSRPEAAEDLDDRHFQPFYDAAWELCRIGVLRPGEFAPRGWATDASAFSGDTFSVTRFGREWPLGQWNDGAGHATMSIVSEVEAHMRLTDLLRLAQFAHEHWGKLTA